MTEEKYVKLPIFDIDKELKNIEFNKNIKKVQNQLIENGYFINNHGKFDKYLFGAICDYQRKNNLKVTGEITEETWNRLFDITKEKENIFINEDKEEKESKTIDKIFDTKINKDIK